MSEMMCDCCDATTARDVMESRHGDIGSFHASVLAAVPSFISIDEANAAAASPQPSTARPPVDCRPIVVDTRSALGYCGYINTAQPRGFDMTDFTLNHTSTDDHGSDGTTRWFDLVEDGEAQVFGLHSNGSFLDCDGAPLPVPGEYISANAQRAMIRGPARSVTLSEEDTARWEDGGSEGDEYRASVRALHRGVRFEIYSHDGVTLDAWGPAANG